MEDSFVLVHVGRCAYPKKHEFLIGVFASVCKRKSNLKLLLVGAGNFESGMKEKVKALGIVDKVLFLGEMCRMTENLEYLLHEEDVWVSEIFRMSKTYRRKNMKAEIATAVCDIAVQIKAMKKKYQKIRGVKTPENIQFAGGELINAVSYRTVLYRIGWCA